MAGQIQVNTKIIKAEKEESHGKEYSIELVIPPMATIVLEPVKKRVARKSAPAATAKK